MPPVTTFFPITIPYWDWYWDISAAEKSRRVNKVLNKVRKKKRREKGLLKALRCAVIKRADNDKLTTDGEIVGVYGICHDITQRKHQEAQTAYQATHDLLTVLPNRTALEDRLEHDFLSSQQNQDLLAILYLNLDGFKAINDTHGHQVGDLVLQTFAERVAGMLRKADTAMYQAKQRGGGQVHLCDLHSSVQGREH